MGGLPRAAHGYRLLPWWHVFALTGLEGFRPAFLFAGAIELPKPSRRRRTRSITSRWQARRWVTVVT